MTKIAEKRFHVNFCKRNTFQLQKSLENKSQNLSFVLAVTWFGVEWSGVRQKHRSSRRN